MARSDLLVALVKAASSGDKRTVRTTAEAIIAEERAKQHTVLADRLSNAILQNGNGIQSPSHNSSSDHSGRGRDFVLEILPRRQLDHLVLPEYCSLAIGQLIEEQNRADILRAHGLEPRHRILLVGPPGTGKTTLAEAIAYAVGVSLFVVRYESIIGSYLGETAGRLKRVFDYARTTPCVLFFDEFDAIGKERGDIHETGEIKRVVTSLLMQIDDLPSYTVVVAATNHPELIDRAAWRRFQLRLDLPLPSHRAAVSYIKSFADDSDLDLGHSAASIVRRLGKVSFSDLEQFCLDLRRRYVLCFGASPMKSIVDEQLAIRAQLARIAASNVEESSHAGASTSNTPDG